MGKAYRGLASRVRRLEAPTPREREAAIARKELLEKLQREFEEYAKARPEAAQACEEAAARYYRYLAEHGGADAVDSEEARRLLSDALDARIRLVHDARGSAEVA